MIQSVVFHLLLVPRVVRLEMLSIRSPDSTVSRRSLIASDDRQFGNAFGVSFGFEFSSARLESVTEEHAAWTKANDDDSRRRGLELHEKHQTLANGRFLIQ